MLEFTLWIQILTLNAFDIVLVMKSRTKPPATVPNIPHTTVIPPNIISALVCTSKLFLVQYNNSTAIILLSPENYKITWYILIWLNF